MITKDVIKRIYKKYPRRAASIDDINMAILFETVGDIHSINIDIELNILTIDSIEPHSPFHTLRLEHIHAFVPFEQWTAIVLDNTIIFLSRHEPKISVHLKPARPTLIDRIRLILRLK